MSGAYDLNTFTQYHTWFFKISFLIAIFFLLYKLENEIFMHIYFGISVSKFYVICRIFVLRRYYIEFSFQLTFPVEKTREKKSKNEHFYAYYGNLLM